MHLKSTKIHKHHRLITLKYECVHMYLYKYVYNGVEFYFCKHINSHFLLVTWKNYNISRGETT